MMESARLKADILGGLGAGFSDDEEEPIKQQAEEPRKFAVMQKAEDRGQMQENSNFDLFDKSRMQPDQHL